MVRAHAALSVLLGEIEGLVGDGDDLGPVEPELRIGDDSGREPHREPGRGLEQAHAPDDPVGHRDRLLLVAAGEEERELVASDPERLAVLAQPAGDLREDEVALRVPQRVVQLLEVVDVEQADAEREALLLRLGEVLVEAVVEVAVVAEAGERVGEREPHGLQLAEDRALVERDGGERAHERGREERRALPEHGQHQGQRSHDREGDEGRGHRPAQERDEAPAPSGSRRDDERDVHGVERGRGEADLEGQPAEAVVRDRSAHGAGPRPRSA